MKKEISVPVSFIIDDKGNIIYNYQEMHDAFELAMSELDPKQYSETSR